MLKELDKLKRLSTLALPADLFTGVPSKVLQAYRLRAAAEPPREMRMHLEAIRYTLLGAFCWQRRQEIIDGLVELLIQVIHRISVRAERRVVKEPLSDFQRVHGKTALLYKLAEAALAQPDRTVREVVYPIIGPQTLAALIKESRSQGPAYRQHVHTLLRSSYSHHYRRMLPPILDALSFLSNNVAHRPVIEALAWLKAHRGSRRQWVACDEVPLDGVVRAEVCRISSSRRPLMARSASVASTTRFAFCRRCGSGCAAKKSGLRVPTVTVTLTMICPRTLSTSVARTIRPCSYRRMRRSSLPRCSRRCTGPSPSSIRGCLAIHE